MPRMGRRSTHTPDQLRELILQAATSIVEREGLAGLSAREIARAIGYSAGTLYNVFNDLDELILTIEGRLLDSLALRLEAAPKGQEGIETVCNLAEAYFAFTLEHPRLWNLLFEHQMPQGWRAPEPFKVKLDALLTLVEAAVLPVIAGQDRAQAQRAARVLWASVHGITSLAVADKLTNITNDTAGLMIQDLVRTYLKGVQMQAHVPHRSKTR